MRFDLYETEIFPSFSSPLSDDDEFAVGCLRALNLLETVFWMFGLFFDDLDVARTTVDSGSLSDPGVVNDLPMKLQFGLQFLLNLNSVKFIRTRC